MRETLFRGKNREGNWEYGYLTYSDQEGIYYIGVTEIFTPVIPETVGQFTGLTDSTGVKIFEGDIVYLAGYGDYTVEYPFIELFEGCFEGDIGSIKGNIHDNPELL